MLPNQSLPSVQTGTEDRTVLYWTEVESGSAKAVEGIDPSVDTPRYSWPNLCWLLFVSVSCALQRDCCLVLALIFIWSAGIHAQTACTRKALIKLENSQSNHNTMSQLRAASIVKPIYLKSTFINHTCWPKCFIGKISNKRHFNYTFTNIENKSIVLTAHNIPND